MKSTKGLITKPMLKLILEMILEYFRPNVLEVILLDGESCVIIYYNGYFESFNIQLDGTKLVIYKNEFTNTIFNTNLMEIGMKIFCEYHNRKIISIATYKVVAPEDIQFELEIEVAKNTAEIIELLEYIFIRDPASLDLGKVVQAIYMLTKFDVSVKEEEQLVEFVYIDMDGPHLAIYLMLILAFKYPAGEKRDLFMDNFLSSTKTEMSDDMMWKIYKYHIFRTFICLFSN